MSAAELAAGAGVVLALLVNYLPGFAYVWNSLPTERRRLGYLALLVLLAGGAFGLSCSGVLADLFGVALACDRAGAVELVRALVAAVVAGVGVELGLPKSREVRNALALVRFRE